MLYLTFFLLRDGAQIISRIESCLPLPPDQRRLLTKRFVEVVRATIKGSLIVAVLQGLVAATTVLSGFSYLATSKLLAGGGGQT